MERLQSSRPSVSVRDEGQLRTITDDATVQEILGALEDEYCRAILEVMSTSFRTAQRISDLCEMPISTTYRKLNTLESVGLVETSIRLRRSGHHTKEFSRAFDAVMVSLEEQERTAITIEPTETD